MSLEYCFTQNDQFLAEIWPFSQGVFRCTTKWKERGKDVICDLFFENFSKPEPPTRKVSKWGLRWGHELSKNVDFTSFGALRKKQSVSSLCC